MRTYISSRSSSSIEEVVCGSKFLFRRDIVGAAQTRLDSQTISNVHMQQRSVQIREIKKIVSAEKKSEPGLKILSGRPPLI